MRCTILFCLLFLIIAAGAVAQHKKIAEPIKGTWITNVASEALSSKANIQQAVQQCKLNGLNTIFVVVWNRGKTMYPSKVLQKYIGTHQDEKYAGRDTLQEMIVAGHKAGLKVHAWFEFGFSYAYEDSNSTWLKKYPQWAGRNNKSELLQTNGFYWWSSINPSVQNFLKRLVLEVVKNYHVDGVQGDDRLPAMAAEGGYDEFTLGLYAKQHNGVAAPHDFEDTAWTQWRADQLSLFGKSLYKAVKKIKPACIVSWAPSIYTWSKQHYLQDWPKWLQEGYADYIIPQLYRYDIVAYEKILKELDEQVPSNLKYKVFPGLLTSLGDGYQSSRELINQMILLNRKYGFTGEVFFYYETLNRLKGKFYSKEKWASTNKTVIK